jgi:predicted NBD/HSP70 family sugar kinase
MSLINSQRQLAVLRFVRDRATVTRAEICEATGLSMSQVSRLTSNLRSLGLITVDRLIGGSEGRPTEILALAGDSRYVIGLDIGGLSQLAVVANLRGEVVASIATTTALTAGREALLEHVISLVNDVIDRASISSSDILGLGVGLRAVVDPITGVIAGGPETPKWSAAWIDFAIRDELSSAFPWELIAVDDTVRALGVAEGRYGRGVGEHDFVYVLADSGIGAAIMIDGRPYLGANRTAGEIGHITLDPNGEPCGCGKIGCLETIASTSALLRRANERFDSPPKSIDELIDTAASGNDAAVRLLKEGGEALGRGLAILHNVLAPSLFVIGGVATFSEIYLESANRVARAEALNYRGRDMRIVPSDVGPLAGATGAGAMILDAFFNPVTGKELRRKRSARAGKIAREQLEGQHGQQSETASARIRGASGRS